MGYYNMNKIIAESAPLLSVLIILEVFGGTMIHNELNYVMLPVLLMLVPLVNSLGGNIGGIFGARISSGLHIGSLRLDIMDKEIRQNILVVLILGAITFNVAPILIWFIAPLMGVAIGIPFMTLYAITFTTGAIVVALIIVLGLSVAYVSFKTGRDPDNFVIPILTTGIDIAGMLCLITVVSLFGI